MASEYIVSRRYDFSFFLIPPFVSVVLAIALVHFYQLEQNENQLLSVLVFVFFITAIDVSHVHATLFRVYFNSEEFQRRRLLYAGLPVLVFSVAVVIYQFGEVFYWRVFAYLAVLHFIRQQYGFVALYHYKQLNNNTNSRAPFLRKNQNLLLRLDKIIIYVATIYPLLYWHLHLPRNFSWFMEGDFISGLPSSLADSLRLLYFLLIGCYALFRSYLIFRFKDFNIGKDLTIIATALTWYVGIVVYNLDLVFTITNVVIHGVAYMALVNFTVKKNSYYLNNPRWMKIIQNGFYFFMLLVAFAFIEEFLWDNLVWFDHPDIFGGIFRPTDQLNALAQILVPLLSVPQVTHYLLDGFIWKMKEDKNPGLKKILMGEESSIN